MNKAALDFAMQQNLETIKAFVKLQVDSIRDEVRTVTRENEELRKSLEFSQKELAEVKQKLDRQDTVVSEMTAKENTVELLTEKLRQVEDYSRRNNLIFSGLPEPSGENGEQLEASVKKLMVEKLNIKPNLDTVHRLGTAENRVKPRPVIVRLTSHAQRQECLRSASKLKGSSVFINEDLGFKSYQLLVNKSFVYV